MKIAVIGGGISGLTVSWLLHSYHEVTLYEKKNAPGLSNDCYTYQYDDDLFYNLDIPIRGFNQYYYKNFYRIIDLLRLNVRVVPALHTMVNCDLDEIYLQTVSERILNYEFTMPSVRLLLNPKFWLRLVNIKWAMSDMKKLAQYTSIKLTALTFGEYLKEIKDEYKDTYNYCLLPLLSTVFTADYKTLEKIPLKYIMEYFDRYVNFFANSSNKNRYSIIDGGINQLSQALLGKNITCKFKNEIANIDYDPVKNKNTLIDTMGSRVEYDHVIIATESHQVLNLFQNPPPEIASIFNQFEYETETLYLHQDTTLMPQNRKCWSTANFFHSKEQPRTMWTLWCNVVYSMPANAPNIFQSNTPYYEINEDKILKKAQVTRPIINFKSDKAVTELKEIQGSKNLWFCGSYSCNGLTLLENGVESAIEVAKSLGIDFAA